MPFVSRHPCHNDSSNPSVYNSTGLHPRLTATRFLRVFLNFVNLSVSFSRSARHLNVPYDRSSRLRTDFSVVSPSVALCLRSSFPLPTFSRRFFLLSTLVLWSQMADMLVSSATLYKRTHEHHVLPGSAESELHSQCGRCLLELTTNPTADRFELMLNFRSKRCVLSKSC